MEIVGKIRRFNTRRQYTKEGQPITWAIVQNDKVTNVVFIDHARHIDGVIDVHFGNLDLIHDDWVLRAYDDYHYHYAMNGEIRFLEAECSK